LADVSQTPENQLDRLLRDRWVAPEHFRRPEHPAVFGLNGSAHQQKRMSIFAMAEHSTGG
jgi:hypothetical protein